MKIFEIHKMDSKRTKRYEIVEELKDGYIINLYKDFDDDEDINIASISIMMRVNVDELHYLQEPSERNINKFNDRFEQVFESYIRRNTT